MALPNLKNEKKLWKKGYKRVFCLDEAGRGPLAGPVIACAAVILIKDFKAGFLSEVNDSKKLAPKKREEIYKSLNGCPAIEWGTGRVSEKIIDKINILEATKLAMRRAVANLERKLRRKRSRGYRADFLIIDGNFKIGVDIPQKPIIKGDEKVFSCAIASIIAKIKRDGIMNKYGREYQEYGFGRHKGYPTEFHRKMIKKFGPCEIHRKSFRPIKK